MRGQPFVPFLALAAILVGAPPARAVEVVSVRPITGAATFRDFASLSPELRRQIEQRSERWRGFPDRLSAPHTDWSRSAMRRRGWRAGTPRRTPAPDAAAGTAAYLDTIRVAILRVDFAQDRGGAASTGNGRFDLSGPDVTLPPVDRPPHNRTFYQRHAEALGRYYDVQSYGRVLVEADVWPREENRAYTVSDMADFGPWEFSQSVYDKAVHMFRTMMLAADTQSVELADRIPWDRYDRFVIIHAGSDFQSDLRQDSKEDIPSFTFSVDDSQAVRFHDVSTPGDSVTVDRITFIPETANQDGFYSAINGVLAHECGHLIFGFYDVYDTKLGLPVVGYWSLMDSGNLLGSLVKLSDGSDLYAIGLMPPSLDPFQRSFTTDQLNLAEVVPGDTVLIRDSERHPDVRAVRLSSDEFLLLENRHKSDADTAFTFDRDSATTVVLGPGYPDRFEYDAWGPGSGLLVWHLDLSVVPNEYAFPIDTSLRADPYAGINENPKRRGLSIVEADGLGDLGDLGSPYLLGSKFDPFFVGNNTVLSDSTHPNLLPSTGTRPHLRVDVLDPPDVAMRVWVRRQWQLPGWPVSASFPKQGPQLLAVDADGDRKLEVCWAGGDPGGPDSTSLFAVRPDGSGLFGPDRVMAQLDRRPFPVMAAMPLGEPASGVLPARGPSWFAVCTLADGPDTTFAGGRVWLIDHTGQPVPGWPSHLPAIVTTPPVIAGHYPNVAVLVGCADGKVYAMDTSGTVIATSGTPLNGPIRGRLAATSAGAVVMVAAGSEQGDVTVFPLCLGICVDPLIVPAPTSWPRHLGVSGFEPDFLWIDFNGTGGGASQVPAACAGSGPQLVVHHADRLWAFCMRGDPLPGWGRDVGDTLVNGLGAGDPDGDGYPEVLTQGVDSKVAFFNSTGYPSPGWPKPGSTEGFRTRSLPLAADFDGDGRGEVVALNASGIIAAMRSDGHAPPGWPLATGVGAGGTMVVADLNQDGMLDLVAPDHLGNLYAYTLATPISNLIATSWTMLGGDAERTSALTADRTPAAPAAVAGPLLPGSLKAFPNPARRHPVSFAYQLSEPASVEFRILDTSGHEVAAFTRAGRPSDNLEVWDPGSLPAGLYLARIEFKGRGAAHVERVPVGVIR